jgi:cytochrome c oxidase cbb3-type subunit 3
MRILVCAFAAALACAQNRAPSALSSQEAAERGRVQFVQSCSFCHGAEATGGTEGPNLVRSSLVRHDSGGDLIGPVIRTGRPGRGMPAIPLTAEQIADVVAFLHLRLRQSDLASPRRPGEDFDLQRLLTGDREAGRAYFEHSCSKCHSPQRDLAHVAKKYRPAELQARFLYPESENPLPVTVTLASGARIQGTLAFEDHFDVGIHDKDGWYKSWPRDQVKLELHDPLAAHEELLAKYSNADIHNLFAYLETLK